MTTLGETIGKLEAMGGFVSLMRLFQANFPCAFRRHVVKRGITPLAKESDQVRAIDAFLESLDGWFPVSTFGGDWIHQQLLEGADVPYLPVVTDAIEDRSDDPATLRFGFRVLLAATKNESRDFAMRSIVGTPIGQYLETDRVRAICASKRGPLRHLADAYAYVIGDTGTFFLDVSDEMYCQGEPAEFTQNSIDWLKDDWAQARQILGRCKRFSDWIEADLRRVKPVVAILREAASRQRIRVMTNGDYVIGDRATPLMQAMDDWLVDEEEEYAEEEDLAA